MNAAQQLVQPGDILAGKYRVDRVLGVGGMGIVVAATHLDLLEPRALKFMLPTALPDTEAVERFLREARATSRLRSEHVTRVYDVGRLDNGVPYMVMECLVGADLNATLKRGGPLPVQQAILYVLQTAEALAEAHGRGIVHRDLKPANLFLSLREDGTHCIKVLDFGISKFTGTAGAEFDVTKTHTVLGSPHYMSPEQMHSSRTVDARSDIWSLGVILYQLVTGRVPFRGSSITEIVAAVLLGAPPLPSQVTPSVPPGLDLVILRCLERDIARRYAHVGELAQGLVPFGPPDAGLAVDRILRLIASPSRSATGLPVVLGDVPLPGATPSPRPADSVTVREGVTPPPASAPIPLPGGVTGAWGSTAASGPLRSRTPLVVAGGGAAALIAGLVAWSVSSGGPPVVATPLRTAAATTAPAAAAPAPTGSAAAGPISPTAAAAPAAPTTTGPEPAVASASPKTRKAPADPFGMQRK